MFPRKPLRISTELDVIPFLSTAPPADLEWLKCGNCHFGLQTHQPDAQSPARLLGTCDGCGHWYLIMLEPDMVSALMVALPETEAFRSAWAEHGGPDGKGTRSPPGKSSRGTGTGPSSAPPGEDPTGDGMVKVRAP
jgi:hypothetical protein